MDVKFLWYTEGMESKSVKSTLKRSRGYLKLLLLCYCYIAFSFDILISYNTKIILTSTDVFSKIKW